jgi:hypothetical protein
MRCSNSRLLNTALTLLCLSFFGIVGSYSFEIASGINVKKGKYAITSDANIYYEVHGKGRSLLLLHGGFSYIDQFKDYIQA